MLDRDRVHEVFAEAVTLAGAERVAFLDGACAGDTELRAEIESLLRAAEGGPAFMAAPEGPVIEWLGARVGPYRLLETIGEGGFGRVFLAEQESPVRRRVALKIIKLGMDTRAVIARFEAERQALAMMDHAHIAKVLDAGATDSGRPYFVMELVEGEPITAYCDRNNLSVTERLGLFVQVCHAVQHAHSKGVIHRDIKPGNVLVVTQDGRPHAKVIDFGIAKATQHRLTEKTLFTESNQLVGTPEYMSPEQAGGSQDIDTRTDVYGLGVLLYELLTGSTPFDAKQLRSAAYAEIQRIIREVEPPKPSTRLSQSATLGDVAAHRRTEPGRLGAIVRGDLDWIVMRALEKDRTRRYDTPSALAADIARYVAGEPVDAVPPSTGYRLRKFVRRHRGLVAACGAVAAVLLLGVTGTSVGLVRANLARAREQVQWRAAQESATRATEAERQTSARAAELEQVVAFQGEQLMGIDVSLMAWRLREDLIEEARAAGERSGASAADRPSPEALGALLAEMNLTNVAVRGLDRNIVQRAVAAIEAQFDDQPLVAARLLQTCGDTLGSLGLYDEAAGLHRRAIDLMRGVAGEEDARALESLDRLGYLLTQAGRFDEAEPHVRAALAGRRRVLGEEAPETLGSLANLGSLLEAQGKFAESEGVYRDALERLRRLARDEDGDTLLRVLGNLAMVLKQRAELEEAEALTREALAHCRRQHGDEDARTLAAMSNLVAVLQARGSLAEATDLAREVLDTSRRVLGDDHPSLLEQVNNLAVLLAQQNRLEEAVVYQREALEGLRRQLGGAHPSTLTALNNVAVVLLQLGRFAEAAELLGEGVEVGRRGEGGELPTLALLLQHRAGALRRAGDLDQAKPPALEAVAMYRAHPDWNAADALRADQALEQILYERGEYAEAEPLVRAALERERHAQPPVEINIAGRLSNLGVNLLRQGKHAEAEATLREGVELRARIHVPGDPWSWQLHMTRSLLGEALVGQAADASLDDGARLARLREAEALLVEAYAGLKDDPRVPIPSPGRPSDPRRDAIGRIVALYEAWERLEPGLGHAEAAAEWRRRADEAP